MRPVATVAVLAHGPMPPATQSAAVRDPHTSFMTTRSATATVARDGGVIVSGPPGGVYSAAAVLVIPVVTSVVAQ